jgi:DNA-binding MarR family transcriptional regulator
MPRRNGTPQGLYGELEAPLRSRHDLHWLAMRLFRGITALENETVRQHGLSGSGYEVLVESAGRQHRTQPDLCAALGLRKSALGEVLVELEKAGFVHRTKDPGDRRVRTVQVTESGTAVLTSVAGELQRIEDEMFSGVSQADREVFFSVLEGVSTGTLKDMQGLPNGRPRRPVFRKAKNSEAAAPIRERPPES